MTQSQHQTRQQIETKRLVERSKTSFTIAQNIGGIEELQKFTQRTQQQESVAWCAVIGIDGACLAHSDSSLVDTLPAKVDPGFTELAIPIEATKDNGAQTILIGRDTKQESSLSSQPMSSLLFATLPALFVIGLGGFFLKRLVQPLAAIEIQLSDFARQLTLNRETLLNIETKDAVSVGWNQLVDEVNNNFVSLEDRVEEQLESNHSTDDHRVLDSLTDGIAQTNAEGQIAFINHAMTALLGMDQDSEADEDQSIRQLLLDNCDDEETGAQIKALFESKSANRPAVVEIQREFGSSKRVLRVARQPMSDENGNSRATDVVPAQVWSVRDITQQKLADKARDEFLDSATHELRTPLANIKAYAETLEMAQMIDVEQQKEFCNVINSEATRLARFIDELLDVSSIESGSLAVQMQKVEISRMLEEAVAKVQPLMTKKNIEFETNFSAKLPELPLDKDKFETCLVNLLGNAAKYTPEGGSVMFNARVAEGQLLVDVQDSGIGIAEGELDKVFEKFFRSDDERVHDETGTGLGLAFAKEVIVLHGGTLTVTSQLDHGSTFTIAIPVGR